jgi:hypothetical protein
LPYCLRIQPLLYEKKIEEDKVENIIKERKEGKVLKGTTVI